MRSIVAFICRERPDKKGNNPMKKNPTVIAAIFALVLVAGCDSGNNKRTVFVFPQGDAVKGQEAFTTLKCYECHRIEGVAGLPGPTVSPEKVVVLGGEVAMPRNYGELITSVIHPSYAQTKETVGSTEEEVKMPDFNDEMTVAQMLDIVTFLHARYKKLKPLYYDDYYGP